MSFFASTVAGDVREQLVQVAGALCVLAGFAAAQLGLLSTRSRLYLVLNLVGSLVLALLALLDRQLGFLLLEGAWALVSAWSLLAIAGRATRRPRRDGVFGTRLSWAIQDSNLGPLPYQRSALTD